jgi:hypothetical protein
MGKKYKSSDVLDPNMMTKVDLRGTVVGWFDKTGPNRWDDYEFNRDSSKEVIDIPAGSSIQLEPLGADPELRFRYRDGRKVAMLAWLKTDEDNAALVSGQWGIQESEQATVLEKIFGTGPKDDPRDDYLEYFLANKVSPLDEESGIGFAAMLVKKLRGR